MTGVTLASGERSARADRALRRAPEDDRARPRRRRALPGRGRRRHAPLPLARRLREGQLDPVRAAALRASRRRSHALLHTSLAICPSIDYLERAWQDATRGVPADGPYIEVEVPTAIDPSLTDDGTTVMTMFTQYGPHDEAGWPDGAREAYAQRCLDMLAALRAERPRRGRCTTRCSRRRTSSGSSGSSAARSSRASRAWTRWRSCARRRCSSRYATPVDGLYLCGAGTHPGGGVIAASGHNAAQARARRIAQRVCLNGRSRSSAGLDTVRDAMSQDSDGVLNESFRSRRGREAARGAGALLAGAARWPAARTRRRPWRRPARAERRTGSWATRRPAARSTPPASRSRAATTRSRCRSSATR